MIKNLPKYIFFIFLLFQFSSNVYAETTWITKKKSTNKLKIEKIEKKYADGHLSKSECVKAKSKLLKLLKVSKTICDNVEVKVAKKEKKSDLSSKTDGLKKQLEKSKKKKKEFKDKEKDLSKDAKTWITKKKKEKKKKKKIVEDKSTDKALIKKKQKHYNSIAELPNSEFYFYAIDENNRKIIGYANQDSSSEYMEIGSKKFRKGNEGKAYVVNQKVTCDIYSEVDKAKSSRVYIGNITMICSDDQQFIGGWIQNGENGRGIATSENGKNSLDFIFSMNQNTAIAKADKKTDPEIIDAPKYNIDKNDPIIKVAKKIESNGIAILKGTVSDDSGEVFLVVNGTPINIDKDGNFKLRVNPRKQKIVVLEAYDNSGNDTIENVKVILTAGTITTDQNYYALIIGNNNYKYLEKLEAAENDARVLAEILEKKYNFKVKLLLNANEEEIVDGMYKLSRSLTDNDNLLIYYAGHGELDKEANKGYWLPIDAKPGTRSKWISNDFITDEAKATKARHVLLFADSCFAGSLMRSGNTKKISKKQMQDENFIRRLERKKTRKVITSGGETYVVDSVGGNHSLFAEKLIETLKKADYVFNTHEIFEDIRRYVMDNAGQEPETGILYETGHDGGEFFFFPTS